jgi:hypothetical protein
MRRRVACLIPAQGQMEQSRFSLSPPHTSTLLCSTLLLPPLGSLSGATVVRLSRRPSQVIGSSSSPLCAARVLARVTGQRHRAKLYSEPSSTLRAPTVDYHLPCTSGSATTLRRTERARSSSTSTPSSPVISCPSCRHLPLHRQAHHCRSTTMVSALPSNHLQ